MVPLVDACDTEWRWYDFDVNNTGTLVPLVDACDTEWREHRGRCREVAFLRCHSLMPVILNGGVESMKDTSCGSVPLVDACDTEWRKRLVDDPDTEKNGATR